VNEEIAEEEIDNGGEEAMKTNTDRAEAEVLDVP
jgi:hypothetical protein